MNHQMHKRLAATVKRQLGKNGCQTVNTSGIAASGTLFVNEYHCVSWYRRYEEYVLAFIEREYVESAYAGAAYGIADYIASLPYVRQAVNVGQYKQALVWYVIERICQES